MKKFLLILSCLAVMLGARAAEQSTTVTFKSDESSVDGGSAIKAEVALADIIETGADFFSAVTETNNVYPATVNGLKFSSSKVGGKVTFSFAEKVNMTKIVVKANKYKNDAATLQVDELPAQELTAELADYTFDVTGEQSSVTLLAEKRLYIASITFFYDNEGGTVTPPVDPDPVVPATIVAPKFNIEGGEFDENVTVELSCDTEGAKIYYTLDGTTPTTASTLYTAPFEIKKGDGTVKVNAIAVIESPMASATFTMASDVEYNSLADLLEGEPLPEKQSGKFVVNFKPVVAYVNGANIYAYEDGKYVLIYQYGNTLKEGDVIKGGWTGYVENYNNLYEIKPVADTVLEADGEGTIPEPAVYTDYTITAENVNEIVVLKNVTFAEATPATSANFTGKMGDNDVTFRNSFKIESVVAGTYDVKAAVAVYKETVQLYPISYTTSVGVNEISAASETEYYNLQGLKVSNPEAGIFVDNKGNKVVIR